MEWAKLNVCMYLCMYVCICMYDLIYYNTECMYVSHVCMYVSYVCMYVCICMYNIVYYNTIYDTTVEQTYTEHGKGVGEPEGGGSIRDCIYVFVYMCVCVCACVSE